MNDFDLVLNIKPQHQRR